VISEDTCIEERFARSALTEDNPYQTTDDAMRWLNERGAENALLVERVPFTALREWSFESSTGDLVHRTGKFFRVHGIRIHVSEGTEERSWLQPIVDQPEIGILGIIAKQIDGQLFFLMQAKLEPGNPAGVQLTPTLQATRSNYTQVHQGARPKYLDYFLDRAAATPLVDQLQFEQGSTFLRKRNRNVIVEVLEDVPVEEDFRWFTLGQIKKLLRVPNLVSMDARTVLACIPLRDRAGHRALGRGGDGGPQKGSFGARLYQSMAHGERPANADHVVQSWLTDVKCRVQLSVERIPLADMPGWARHERAISHEGARFFEVVGVTVRAKNREVSAWDQPLVSPREKGMVAFLVKEIGGVLHFLVQGVVEPGNPDIVSVGATVHCVLSERSVHDPASWPPYMEEAVHAPQSAIRYSCVQSEEGGRFYHAENEYRVVEVDPTFAAVPSDRYCWVTLRQLNELVRWGLVNVEARSLLACLSIT